MYINSSAIVFSLRSLIPIRFSDTINIFIFSGASYIGVSPTKAYPGGDYGGSDHQGSRWADQQHSNNSGWSDNWASDLQPHQQQSQQRSNSRTSNRSSLVKETCFDVVKSDNSFFQDKGLFN